MICATGQINCTDKIVAVNRMFPFSMFWKSRKHVTNKLFTCNNVTITTQQHQPIDCIVCVVLAADKNCLENTCECHGILWTKKKKWSREMDFTNGRLRNRNECKVENAHKKYCV